MTQAFVPCTLQTCPLSDGIITYQPNLGANGFFLACFGIMLIVQIFLGIRYHTWSYLIGMGSGLILEIIGYVGRLQLHSDPFQFNYFIEYLVCLTIAPAFLSASIYICFYRMVLAYDYELSRINPKAISIIFITSDIICLILQAVGGAITSTSDGTSALAKDMRQTGITVMIAGLALQVVSLSFFIVCVAEYSLRYHNQMKIRGPVQNASRNRGGWKGFMICLAIATTTIFIRSVYRTAELRDGFQGKLANNEITFMIFEGAMILIACFCLTFYHPGPKLGSSWKVGFKPQSSH